VITAAGTHAAAPNGIQGPSSAVTSAPPAGVFTTSLVDGGSAGAYVGPSFTLYSIAAPGALTVSTSNTNFVAGTSPITITAKIASKQPGVPLTLSTTAGTLALTISSTGATGSTTVTFTPPNKAGTPSATVTVTVADGQAVIPTGSVAINTLAAAPSTVSFTFTAGGAAVPATHYIENSFVTIAPNNYANIATNVLTYTISDAFANLVTGISGTCLGSTAPCGQFAATNGFFDSTPSKISTGVNSYTAVTGTIVDLPAVRSIRIGRYPKRYLLRDVHTNWRLDNVVQCQWLNREPSDLAAQFCSRGAHSDH